MKNKDIERVITQKRAYKSSSFLFRWDIKDVKQTQTDLKNKGVKQKTAKNIAILTPKKVFSTAVLRNSARRRLKNAFMAQIKDILGKEWKKGLKDIEVVVTAGEPIKKALYKDIYEEMKQALVNSGMIQKISQQ